jgi:hypothetical protein
MASLLVRAKRASPTEEKERPSTASKAAAKAAATMVASSSLPTPARRTRKTLPFQITARDAKTHRRVAVLLCPSCNYLEWPYVPYFCSALAFMPSNPVFHLLYCL